MKKKEVLPFKKSFHALLSKNATSAGGILSQTIKKTYDYIDGGFVKEDSLLLCNAQPLYDIPKYVRDYMMNTNIPNNFYTKVSGDKFLVEALKLNAASQGICFNKEENIMVTAGANNGFSALCHALCDSGDVILALSPSYILFADCVKAYGGELVLVPSRNNGKKFEIAPQDLEKIIQKVKAENRNIKGLLVINPTNVEGQFWTEDEISKLVPIINKHDLLVIEDRVYDQLFFDVGDQTPAFFANNPDISNRCVTIDSVSKRYGATQWRVGWVYGPAEIIKIARDYVMNSVWSMVTLFQRASAYMIASTFPDDIEMPANMNEEFKDFFVSAKQYCKDQENYFVSLLDGYQKRRDLSMMIINGVNKYQEMVDENQNLTSHEVLLTEYGDYIEDYKIDLDGIDGFSTPIIPRAAMFIAINANDSAFKKLPSYLVEHGQMLHRLIYLNTKVVLLPPSEVTLPEGENFYRMEYGVAPELLFEALSKLQRFMNDWFSMSDAERNILIQEAYETLPEKYKTHKKAA